LTTGEFWEETIEAFAIAFQRNLERGGKLSHSRIISMILTRCVAGVHGLEAWGRVIASITEFERTRGEGKEEGAGEM
jgi:hypothetical protein